MRCQKTFDRTRALFYQVRIHRLWYLIIFRRLKVFFQKYFTYLRDFLTFTSKVAKILKSRVLWFDKNESCARCGCIIRLCAILNSHRAGLFCPLSDQTYLDPVFVRSLPTMGKVSCIYFIIITSRLNVDSFKIRLQVITTLYLWQCFTKFLELDHTSRLDQMELLLILQVVLGASLSRFTLVQSGLDCKIVLT